jgi:predicted Zn-dependent protease
MRPLTRLPPAAYKCWVRSSCGVLVPVIAAGALIIAAPTAAGRQAAPASRTAPGGPDAVALRSQADAAMEASRFGDAEAAFQKLVGLTPTDPLAHMQLGMARAMGGRASEAIAPLREALRLRPDLLPAKLFLGISYLEVGRPKDALAPLRQVVQADKDNANARQALAEALLTLDQYGEASVQLEALAAAQPSSPQAWAALGRSYEGISREAFARLQALNPDSPYVWLLAADVLTIEEKYPQAFALMKKAQAALPTLPGVHRSLAGVYAASGHADWAAVEQKLADQEKPACDAVPVACAYLAGKPADVIARTASATQAAALYWRARAANDLAGNAFATLEKLPPSVERYVVRAGIARDQGQPLEAAVQLREALTLAPGDPGLERDLAGALYAARDFAAALPLLEKLHGMAPDAPDLLVALGEALLQAQQVDRAVALLTKAVSIDPSVIAAQAALGRALVQAGEHARAVPHLENALATDRDGSVHYQLAQAMQRTGNPARAKVLLAEYQKRSAAAAPAAPVTPQEGSAITPPVP